FPRFDAHTVTATTRLLANNPALFFALTCFLPLVLLVSVLFSVFSRFFFPFTAPRSGWEKPAKATRTVLALPRLPRPRRPSPPPPHLPLPPAPRWWFSRPLPRAPARLRHNALWTR